VRIPDDILKCVVFIGHRECSGVRYRGTGFSVAVEHTEDGETWRFAYLVTAKHTSDAVRHAPFYVRINSRLGTPEDVQMNWEVSQPTIWYEHPNDPDADVAMTPVLVPPEADALCIPRHMIVDEARREQLRIGIAQTRNPRPRISPMT
jgi:hypothetical protein